MPQGIVANGSVEVPPSHSIEHSHLRFFKGTGGIAEESNHVSIPSASPAFGDLGLDARCCIKQLIAIPEVAIRGWMRAQDRIDRALESNRLLKSNEVFHLLDAHK